MKNLFALLCTAALLAGCGGGAATSPDPQKTDTPAPDSSTSTPTPDPTPSDTTPDTSDSSDGNADENTGGTGGGSSGTAGGNSGGTGGANSGGGNGGNTAGTSGGSGGSTGGSTGGSSGGSVPNPPPDTHTAEQRASEQLTQIQEAYDALGLALQVLVDAETDSDTATPTQTDIDVASSALQSLELSIANAVDVNDDDISPYMDEAENAAVTIVNAQVSRFDADEALEQRLREEAERASQRLSTLNRFTALADSIQNHQDYLDFDQAIYEHIIENDEVLTADDIEYLNQLADIEIQSIYPILGQATLIREFPDVPESRDLDELGNTFIPETYHEDIDAYTSEGYYVDGSERFFIDDSLSFRGIRGMFEANIKLDYANGNTVLNDSGNSVSEIGAASPFTDTYETDFVLGFEYTRGGNNRIVRFQNGDRNEDGEYYIPAGTAGGRYEGYAIKDSPYDINTWGWWQQTGFRGSQETWPYVRVLGLFAGDETTYDQFHYVITGPATLPADMPTDESARFRGDFYGQAYRKNSASNDHRQRLAGDVEIIFGFDDGTASGSITNIRGRAPGLPWTSVSNFDQWSNSSFTITNGVITGNTFQATLTGVDTSNSPDVASVRGFTGDIDGGFFGPPEIYEMMIGAGVTASRDLDGTDNDLNLFGYIVGQE